jgi:type I restriction enzyme S subunit
MATTLMFEATINQHLLYLKPFASGAEVGYLRLIFDMAYRYLRSESDAGGSTKGAITRDMIAKLRVPVPPLAEQGVIAAHLNAQTQKLDSLTSKVEHAIALMREHRTALISAAVTGKIDVREAPEAIHA